MYFLYKDQPVNGVREMRVVTICSENHDKPIHILCEQSADF